MKAIRRYVNEMMLNFFGPPPKFKVDDAVQHVSGGPLMIVIFIMQAEADVSRRVCCRWYDREKKCNQEATFFENELKLFDWYKVK